MKPCLMNGRYEFMLPDHLADWDALSLWERERTESMEEHLKPGMVLYDVGSEHGAQSVIYQSFVGPENMVLIEPSCSFWPNLRLIWEHNGLHAPLASVHALIGEDTYAGDDISLWINGWPPCAAGDEQPARSYAYIHDPGTSRGVAQWRLDALVANLEPPDAITIDVEGAELSVLKGAVETLRDLRPIVWTSVHPDLMERDYGTTPDHLHGFMDSLDYVGIHLATDHEAHFVYFPKERP